MAQARNGEPASLSPQVQSKASPSAPPPMHLESTLLSVARLDVAASSIPLESSQPVPLTPILSQWCSHHVPSQQESDHGPLGENPSVAFPSTWHRAPQPPVRPRELCAWTTGPFCREPPQRKKEKKVNSLSRVRLCDPMDGSPPGSSVPGIFQARILGQVAISFSRGSS